MNAQILSRKVIKPQIPTPLNLKNYSITFLDQLAPKTHVGFVFFFPTSSFKSSTESKQREKNNNRCDHLEKSLSETLTLFYPLAGRFIRGDFVVDCSDQGVEVSRARVNGEIAEIIHGSPETKLLDNFVHDPLDLTRSVQWPVLSVQINVFDCGGIAIGVQILHTVSDAFSVFAFMKEWATINRRGLNQEPVCCPSFELGSLFPARNLAGLKPAPPGNFTPNKLITKSFLFDGATISALIAEARTSDSGNLPERKPSKAQVVTAHIWRNLIQIAQAKHGHFRQSLMSFAMNLRGRLRLRLPENSFGNLVGRTIVRYNADDSKLELNDLVPLLRNAIRKTSEDYAKTGDGDELYSMLIDYFNEIEGEGSSEVDHCLFTSLCGFSYYEIDFGWGNLTWVATVFNSLEMVLLMDDKCGDGIEAWVTLKEDEMVEFQCRYLNQCKPCRVEICSKL